MQTDKDFEGLIDRALSSYADARPSSGLEQRVLNRIRAVEIARRRFTGLRWALALAIPALVWIAIAVRFQYRPTPHIAPVASLPIVTLPNQPRLGTLRVSAGPSLRTAPTRQALPKQEQFPAVAPLSGEERLLLAFVRRDPNEAVRTFADLEKRGSQPLEIEAVEIKPLATDGAH